MVGKVLSHYRIAEKLGQGGMGEVYRAEDMNLPRQVAIKVLPDEFAHDAERLARFQREAQVLASLSHPNIATLYGLEESEGKRFIVMELVEGQTLAHRLLKGPLPVGEAVEVCRQIAEGLEAAHEKGVIHRDLKPGNVMITADDKVKILDFGLAKALVEPGVGDWGSGAGVSHSPTITEAMTRTGVILGTAAYMAPEQAKGKAVDKRADIWAFGCILFECLTGKRAFRGENVTEVMAKVLEAEPDWSLLPAAIPPRMADLLRRCLRKGPKERLHDIVDARIEIEEAMAQMSSPRSTLPLSRGIKWNLGILLVILALVAGIVLDRLWVSISKQSPTREVMHFGLPVQPASQLAGGWGLEQSNGGRPTRTALSLTRDGRQLVFYGLAPNGKTQLYTRSWDKPEGSPIPGTEGAFFPFLSPDNKWVGFFLPKRMVKVPIEGGSPTTICDLAGAPPYGASWGSKDVIVYSQQDRLWKVRASGGKPEAVSSTDFQQGEFQHILPYFLPAGDAVLFSVVNSNNTAWDNPAVEVLMLPTGRRKLILDEGADARYVPTGHLLFVRRGKLWAIPFDLDRLQVAGEPTVMIENVMQAMNSQVTNLDTFAAQFSASDSGTLAFVPGGICPDAQHTLDWFDRKGTITRANEATPPYWNLRLSPDGSRVTYHTLATQQNVFVLDFKRGTSTQITFGGSDSSPIWNPDGKNITYGSSTKKAPDRILQVSAAGGGQPKVLMECPYGESCFPADWSPDGKHLVYAQGSDRRNWDIFVLHVEDGKTEAFLKTPFGEEGPDLSPDGRWMAYTSDETGPTEVYVRPFPGPGDKYTISTSGGQSPTWNADGSELYYSRYDGAGKFTMMAVETSTKGGFVAGKSHALFSFSQNFFFVGNPVRGYDTDGRRFLAIEWKNTSLQPVTHINFVINWFEELRRLCPTGK